MPCRMSFFCRATPASTYQASYVKLARHRNFEAWHAGSTVLVLAYGVGLAVYAFHFSRGRAPQGAQT